MNAKPTVFPEEVEKIVRNTGRQPCLDSKTLNLRHCWIQWKNLQNARTETPNYLIFEGQKWPIWQKTESGKNCQNGKNLKVGSKKWFWRHDTRENYNLSAQKWVLRSEVCKNRILKKWPRTTKNEWNQQCEKRLKNLIHSAMTTYILSHFLIDKIL